jgi:hypothetical protein
MATVAESPKCLSSAWCATLPRYAGCPTYSFTEREAESEAAYEAKLKEYHEELAAYHSGE